MIGIPLIRALDDKRQEMLRLNESPIHFIYVYHALPRYLSTMTLFLNTPHRDQALCHGGQWVFCIT